MLGIVTETIILTTNLFLKSGYLFEFPIVACEHQLMKLDCPNGATIQIHSASYGRKSRTICSNGSNTDQTVTCHSASSLQKVRGKCDGNQRCSVFASNSVFGDPCHGVFKYLDVQYSCFTQCECNFNLRTYILLIPSYVVLTLCALILVFVQVPNAFWVYMASDSIRTFIFGCSVCCDPVRWACHRLVPRWLFIC